MGMDINGKVALITGANKGIGYEIARQLGEQGIRIVVGARDRVRGEEAVHKLKSLGIGAEYVHLDVTDQQTIDLAVQEIQKLYGKLDILVNNAGVFMHEGPPSSLEPETIHQVYNTNVFGVIRVTRAMLPLIRKSEAGRIVNMSSSLGSLSLHSTPDFELGDFVVLGYNSSKTAVNAFTVLLAKELKGTPIKVNSADPGYCATEMNGFTGPRSPEQGARAAVRLATLPADGLSGGFYDEYGEIAW